MFMRESEAVYKKLEDQITSLQQQLETRNQTIQEQYAKIDELKQQLSLLVQYYTGS